MFINFFSSHLANLITYAVAGQLATKLPYTAKHSRGKTFAVFHSIVNVFPRIMALLIGNVGLQACYRESFPVNGNFVP